MTLPWYCVTNVAEIASPAVLVYPVRIRSNLDTMIASVGDVSKLRPHVKTHKMSRVVQMKLDVGITKFKASTIAEVEMVLNAGGLDVLLAYQPVGPNIQRLIDLTKQNPAANISTLFDNRLTLSQICSAALSAGVTIPLYLDLDVGMNRTGVLPGTHADQLYTKLADATGVSAAGFHAYDGHLYDADLEALNKSVETAFAPVWELKRRIEERGISVPNLIAGGTPTSHLLARHGGIEVGGGTSVLWDAGQPLRCPTLNYQNAAVLLSRVISVPDERHVCVDLGHKAVASEFAPPRVRFFGLEDAIAVMHSEEHLVLKTDRARELVPGSELYGLPFHICPTIALHQSAWCVRDHRAVGQWPVTARDRYLTV